MMFIIVFPDKSKPQATEEELESWYQSIMDEMKTNGYEEGRDD